jgi:hypothetical protein
MRVKTSKLLFTMVCIYFLCGYYFLFGYYFFTDKDTYSRTLFVITLYKCLLNAFLKVLKITFGRTVLPSSSDNKGETHILLCPVDRPILKL